MKKVLFSLFATLALLAGSVSIADAATNSEKFTVRFRENTLIVRSTQMTEARLYTLNGKLIKQEVGNFVEFELIPGTYVLCASVNDETIARKIILK